MLKLLKISQGLKQNLLTAIEKGRVKMCKTQLVCLGIQKAFRSIPDLSQNRYIITFIFCMCYVCGLSQTKRLTKPIPCIPINFAAMPFRGLEGSSATIKIDKNKVAVAKLSADETTASVSHINDTIGLVTIDMPAKYVFDIIKTIGSYSVIKFWEPINNNSAVSNYEYYSKYEGTGATKTIQNANYSFANITIDTINKNGVVASANKKLYIKNTKDYYLVKTSELLAGSEDFIDKRNAWNVGAMFLPVKLRPFASKSGFFDFTNDLSIGACFAWTMKQNLQTDATWNFLLYTGISSVKVDSAIANFPVEDSLQAKTFLQTQNITAFSPAIGIYREKKNIQLGIVIGMDFLARSVQKNWVYRGMPWIGLSAGVNIFNITNNKGTNGTDQK